MNYYIKKNDKWLVLSNDDELVGWFSWDENNLCWVYSTVDIGGCHG